MTINEIKELAKKLNDQDVEKIKAEIKSKEDVLKNNNLDEEELGEILNSLFAILVIEKALESEIEGIEDIRDELQQELMESYELYDSYMLKFKKEDKKKKKRWLINFLMISDRIHGQKEGIRNSDKIISKLQSQLNELRSQTTNDNLKEVAKGGREHPRYRDFCDAHRKCHHPRHHREELFGLGREVREVFYKREHQRDMRDNKRSFRNVKEKQRTQRNVGYPYTPDDNFDGRKNEKSNLNTR